LAASLFQTSSLNSRDAGVLGPAYAVLKTTLGQAGQAFYAMALEGIWQSYLRLGSLALRFKLKNYTN